MKKYRIRIIMRDAFYEVIVSAANKKNARSEARQIARLRGIKAFSLSQAWEVKQ